MTTVLEAARTLLSVCDGAVTKDGQGYNGLDSMFIRDVLGRIDENGWTLTAKQEAAVHRTLRKYVKQLAGFGIDYDHLIIEKPLDNMEGYNILRDWDKSEVKARVGLARLSGLDGKVGSKAAKDLTVSELEALKKFTGRVKSTLNKKASPTQPGPMKLDLVKNKDFLNFMLYSTRDFATQARAIPTSYWHPETKSWSFHNKLEVVEAITPYIKEGRIEPTVKASEEIGRILGMAFKKAEEGKKVQEIKSEGQGSSFSGHLPLKTEPFWYQLQAFKVGITLDQAAFLMEQGTGKTLSAIGVAGWRFQKGQIKKLLIVSPLSVISVWQKEFQKHADFSYRILDLTKKDNFDRELELKGYEPKRELKVALMNYESTWRCDRVLLDWKPDMVIVDESQKIKNGRAKQSKALWKLGDIAKFKLILSGTPITQGPLDTWSQYRFLNPSIFGKRFLTFRDNYAIMGGYGGYEITGYKNLSDLSEKAHSIAYRITKDEAGLNIPAVDQTIEVVLPSSTREIYEKMEEDFLVEFGDQESCSAPIVLTQLLRLQQITGGFLPIDEEEGKARQLDSSKLQALKDFVEDLPEKKKIVIFARFVPEIDAILEVIKSLGRRAVVLKGGVKDRGRLIDSFQDDPKVTVFIAQIQTGGLGITVTASDLVIFYSTTFSFADYDQAKARISRIGQKSNFVTYVHLITKNTVDEEILDILNSKGDMASLVLDKMRSRLGENSSSRPFTNTQNGDMMGNGSQINLEQNKGKEKKVAKKVETKEVKGTKNTEDGLTKKLAGLKAEADKKAPKAAVQEKPEVKKVTKSEKTQSAKTTQKEAKEEKATNEITLKELLKDTDIDPKAARRTLRKELERAEGERWAWVKGSKELEQVKGILGLGKAAKKASKK